MNLPDLLGKVKIDNSQAKAALGEVKTESASASAAMGTAGKSAQGLAIGFTAAATAAAVVVGTISSLVQGFARAGAELYDLNKQFGIGVVEIQKIQYAAKQSGVTMEALATSINQMEKAAAKTPEKFEQLGISFGKLRTAKPDELLNLISDGLKGVESQSERSKIAQEIFGESGAKMLRMLAGDYRGLQAESEKTSLMTEKMAEKAKQLDGAFKKASDAVEKLKINLGGAFASPAILKGLELMTGLIGIMAKNADKLALALTDSMPGIGLLVRGYNAFAGDAGSASGSSGVSGAGSSGGAGQYTLGKGYDKTAKALADLDKALDKLDAKMARDAEKANKANAQAAKKFSDFMADYAREFAKIPDTASGLAKAVRDSIADGMNRAGYGPQIATELNGVTTVTGKGAGYDIPDEYKPQIAQWISDPDQANWFNHATKADEAAAAQARAAESAARWAGALQGVALIAGAIGGKIGATASVMMNIAKSFEGWDKMGETGKFNAIAGGVGQIGGLIGGTAGAGIQGAAGGAMSGMAIGGPVGAVVGGLAGGIMGLFGGKAKAKAELDELKKGLSGLSDEAKKFGINIDAAMASKNSGVVKGAIDQVNNAIKESEKRLAGLSMASGGFNAFTKGGGITDQASFDRSGMYAGAIFGGQLKETGDAIAALRSIGPALEEMQAKAKDLGLNVGGVVENLLGMNNVLNANEGLADQVGGINQMMKGLSDAGMMTKDMFSALGTDATAVFNRLIEGGATGNQALTLMQPTLQQLYEGQKLHGYAVDEATQALLDQAKAEGIVGDAFMSANERMVELLGILIETLGGKLPESYRRAGDAAEEYGRRATNSMPRYPSDGGYNPGSSPDSGGDDSGPGFAGGTSFRNFGSGTRVTLHGEEAVMRRDQVDRLVSLAVAGTPVYSGVGSNSLASPPAPEPIIVQLVVDGSVLATTVAKQMDRRSAGGTAIRTAIGVNR